MEITRLSGVTVSLPDGVSLADETTEGLGLRNLDFRAPIDLEEDMDPAFDEVRATFGQGRLQVLDTLDVVPYSGVAPNQPVNITIPDTDAHTAVLVNDGGVLGWVWPAVKDGVRTLVLDPSNDTGSTGWWGSLRDRIWRWTGGRIKAAIIRFFGHQAARRVIAREAIPMGWIHLPSVNPARWHPPTRARRVSECRSADPHPGSRHLLKHRGKLRGIGRRGRARHAETLALALRSGGRLQSPVGDGNP